MGLPLSATPTFYFEGKDFYAALHGAIADARFRIDLEMYIFESDEVGWEFAKQLSRKAQQGVEVRVCYDSIGCQGTDEGLFLLMAENGVRLKEYNPTFPLPRNLRRRNHRKVMIVDDRIGFLGGFNLMAVDWRDTGVSLTEPRLVQELKYQFDLVWQNKKLRMHVLARRKWKRRSLRSPAELQLVPSFGLRRFSLIRHEYLRAIVQARERIDITNSYFVPDLGILRALRKAARRGRQVRILTAGKSDVPVAKCASEAIFSKLLRAGARIFEYQPTILHAKSAVIDGRWFTVGTANIDHLSFFHNLEINLFGVDLDSAEVLSQRFDRDLADSREILLEEWKQRPRWKKIREKLCYFFRAWM